MLAGGDNLMINSDKLSAILERVNLWSTETKFQTARNRRKAVFQNIDSTINHGGKAGDQTSETNYAPDNEAA